MVLIHVVMVAVRQITFQQTVSSMSYMKRELYRPDTICPGCGQLDPQCEWTDIGIGPYEYWGAPGVHTQMVWVTECCEADAEEFWPEPVEEMV